MPYTTKALPYSNPTTSREAAESQTDHVPTDEARILRLLALSPSTCESLEHVLALSHQTASARIRGLVKQGRVKPAFHPDGTTQYRKTASGRRAIVWTLREADVMGRLF